MSACYTSNTNSGEQDASADKVSTQRVLITVSDELMAAVEGWRQAHGVDQSEAIGTLVRLGLMSEIAKIYRLVSENRISANDKGEDDGERKARTSDRHMREDSQQA